VFDPHEGEVAAAKAPGMQPVLAARPIAICAAVSTLTEEIVPFASLVVIWLKTALKLFRPTSMPGIRYPGNKPVTAPIEVAPAKLKAL
jgi:hypothetical protein